MIMAASAGLRAPMMQNARLEKRNVARVYAALAAKHASRLHPTV
jgi:hypothetical protein